jgi:hypothetical protein
MACDYIIDRRRRLVISTARDRFTFAEAKGHQDKLIADPDFNPAYNQPIDMRAVTVFPDGRGSQNHREAQPLLCAVEARTRG